MSDARPGRDGRTAYALTTRWRFDAPLEAVWTAVADAEGWPRWWPGVERVATVAPGDGNGVGARRRCTFRSVLPFRLVFETCVTRVEPLRLLEGRVEGELEGVGRCHFARAGGLTLVRHEWRVHTTRAWMNRAAPLLKPLLCWNHAMMMRAGGRGLARHLVGAAVAPAIGDAQKT